MRHLLILRHAKSSWSDGTLRDHERPLNGRGLKQATQLAKLLVEGGFSPSLILSSDARRTEETALLMEPIFDSVEVQFMHSLYLGELHDIHAALIAHGADHQTVLVLGHNPGFSLGAALLTNTAVELKTACAAVLKSKSADWEAAFMTKSFELISVIEGR